MGDENILPENNSNKKFDESKKGLSIASMVLGIIGICFLCYGGFIISLLAVIFGAFAVHNKEGIKGMATAGIVLGIINIILTLIIIISIIIITIIHFA